MLASSHEKAVVSEWVTLDGVFDADRMDKWFKAYRRAL
jgi:hypothetical protein